MSRRRITILVWVLWFVHLFANIEAWLQWKRQTGKVQWLPPKDATWR